MSLLLFCYFITCLVLLHAYLGTWWKLRFILWKNISPCPFPILPVRAMASGLVVENWFFFCCLFSCCCCCFSRVVGDFWVCVFKAVCKCCFVFLFFHSKPSFLFERTDVRCHAEAQTQRCGESSLPPLLAHVHGQYCQSTLGLGFLFFVCFWGF